VGLLEVCACLLDNFELLVKLPLSHIGVRHVEQEEAAILQAMTRSLKLDMATIYSSAFLKCEPCDVTFLDAKWSQQGSLMLRKKFKKINLYFVA